MKRSFFANAIILTLTSQFLRIIGIFFISFLSGKVGTEGVGLYQLIMSIYWLACTLASSGLGTAVSRLTADSVAKSGGKSTSNVVRRSVFFSVILGTAAGMILYFSSGFIGSVLLGDLRTILSLKMLSAGLPFMAVTSSIRGYFYGTKKVLKPAAQMIFEQMAQLIILFFIINFFLLKGLEYACFAISISSTASEVLSCFFGMVLYFNEKKKTSIAVLKEKSLNRQIFGISLPLAASSYLRAGLRSAENILIPSGLRKYGASESEALSNFGLLGMAMPVLLFPSSFLSAIATLLIPEISAANALKNVQKIKFIFSRVFQLTSVISLLFCGIYVAFAYDFGTLIYNNNSIGTLILMMAPLVPLIYLDFIVDAMLNGLNRQVKTFKINVLDYAIRITFIIILIPRFGFWAYIPILYFSTCLNAFLSIKSLLTASVSKLDYPNWILKPLLCVLLSGSLVILLFKLLPSPINWVLIIIKMLLFLLVYALLLYILKAVNKVDINWLKGIVRASKTRKEHESGENINLQEILK